MGKVAPLVEVMVAMVNDGVGGDGDDGLSLYWRSWWSCLP